MGDKLFTNVNVFDGTSKETYPADVLVAGNRVLSIAVKGKDGDISAEGAEMIDCGGRTLMPGLVNTHSHISFNNGASAKELGAFPPEETVLTAIRNAETVIDHGFTACVSAASAKPRTDIVLKNQIEAGHYPGPRLLAGTPELTVIGGLCAEFQQYEQPVPGPSIVCNGAEEFQRTIRLLIHEGVDIVKFNNSGDSFTSGMGANAGDLNPMSDAEVDAVCDTAKRFGKRLAAHAHSDAAVLQCLDKDVTFIYHATYASESTIEKLLHAQNAHYVAPAIGIRYTTVYEASDWGITEEVAEQIGTKREFEDGCKVMARMHDAGIKVLPFGDYGFAWTPHGTESRDLEYFVNYMDFSPWEALRAATAYGGEAWVGDTGEKMGQVREGFLADLLLIDGNPVDDLTLLQDSDRILMVMKDGEYHKAPQL